MKSILRPLVLALLAGICPAQLATPQVHLDVELGRAILVTTHGVQPLTALRGVTPFRGPGHLELAPGSRAVLRWPGIGSVSMRGPSSVAWHVSEDGRVELNFGAVGAINLEVRSLPLRVDLPGAWRLDLQTGAYSLYTRGGGGLDFVHRAGQAARATWVGGGSLAPPPTTVLAGEHLSLQGMPNYTSRQDTSAGAPRWNAAAWPWGNGSIENVPDLAVANAPAWAAEIWPWGAQDNDAEAWERWDWPWGAEQGEQEEAQGVTQTAPNLDAERAATAAPVERDVPGLPKPSPERSGDVEPRGDAPNTRSGPAGAPLHEPEERSSEWYTPFAQAHELGEERQTQESVAPPESSGESSAPAPVEPSAEPHRGPQAEPQAEPRADSPAASPADSPADSRTDSHAPVAHAPESHAPESDAEPEDAVDAEEPTPVTTAQPTAQPASHDPSLWRNLPLDKIEDLGAFRVQRGTALVRETLPNGDLRLTLDSNSSEAYWYFSRHLDVRIFPGASLVIGPDGYLRYHNGTVRILTCAHARAF